jgi:hypothetical protein
MYVVHACTGQELFTILRKPAEFPAAAAVSEAYSEPCVLWVSGITVASAMGMAP